MKKRGLDFNKFLCHNEQITDIFTKALSREQFEKDRLELGLIKIT